MNRMQSPTTIVPPDAKASTPIQVKVWDLLVRIIHWTLVVSFTTGYLITKKFPLHAFAGYTIFALVVLRIIWGFIGSPYARFSSFTYSPRETVQYTLSAFHMGHAREYLSHNPMGAIMVYILLTLLLTNTVLGTMLYGAQQLEGPLEGIVPTAWDEDLLTIHQYMAKLLLGMAGMHLFGVAWATWWHRQNYVGAMFTGYKSAFTRRSHREGSGVWTPEQRKKHRGQ